MILRLVKWFSAAAFTLILLLGAVTAWLLYDEETLNQIAPNMITSALQGDVYSAEFERLEVTNVDWDGSMAVSFSSLSMIKNGTFRIATIPNLNLTLNWHALLLGYVSIERVMVENPYFMLTRRVNGETWFSTKNEQEEVVSHVPIAMVRKMEQVLQKNIDEEQENAPSVEEKPGVSNETLIRAEELFGFLSSLPDELTLRGFHFELVDEIEKRSVHWNDVTIALQEEDGVLKGNGRASFELPTQTALVNVIAEEVSSGRVDVSLEFSELDIASVCAVKPKQCGELAALSFPVSGKVGVEVSAENGLELVDFAFKGEQTAVTHPEWFTAPAMLEHYLLEGEYAALENDLKIKQLRMELPKATIEGVGHAQYLDADPTIEASLSGANIDIAELNTYWPTHIAVDARNWVTDHLLAGTVTKASVKVDIDRADWQKEIFPTEALFAELDVQDATLLYLPNYPKVELLDASVMFTAKEMAVVIADGKTLKDSKVLEGTVRIPDFSVNGMPMEIDLMVDTSAADVARFINPPRYTFAKKLKFNPKTIKGRATGEITLRFNTSTPVPGGGEETTQENDDAMGDVYYAINAQLHKVGQKGIQGVWDFANVDAEVVADAKGVEMKGIGLIHGEKSKFSIESVEGKPTHYTYSGSLPKAKLSKFGFPEIDALTGWVSLDADVTEYASKQVTKLNVGLTNATVDLGALGMKESGKKANMSFVAHAPHKSNETELKQFRYSGEGFMIKGNVVTDGALGIRRATLPSLKFNQTELALDYHVNSGVHHITVEGPMLSLREEETEENIDSGFSLSTLSPFVAMVDIEAVSFGKGKQLSNVKGNLHCHGERGRCMSGEVTAFLPSGEGINMAIGREGGQRGFSLSTNDAAGLMKATDIHDDVTGGTLDIKGTYDDSKPNSPLNGRVLATDFTLRNAPILGKLLTLGSFTGLLDTLQGKGIKFEKFSSHFRLADDTLTLQEGRVKGDAIGATIEGDIRIDQNILNLKGTLFPAYFLNTLISNVPILGELIAGGEGEGIVGIRYSVKGNASDPKVGVNPLSALTPGFTRNFFDAFESGSGAAEEPVKEAPEERGTILNQEEALPPLEKQDVEVVPAL